MRWTFSLMLLGALLATGATAVADPSHDHHITLEAHESGCEQGTFCFVPDAELPAFAPGDVVKVTLVNTGAAPHDVYVTTADNANTAEGTDPATALNNTATVNPGDEAAIIFTVPQDASGLYFWCNQAGHESGLGMWLEASVGDAMMNGTDGMDHDDANDDGAMDHDDDAMENGDEPQNGSPLPAALAVAAIAIAAASMFVRRD